MCIGVFACMYVHVSVSDPLEPELQTVESCHVGPGNWTRVLWKSSSGKAASALNLWAISPVPKRPWFLDVLHPLWLLHSFCLVFDSFPEPWVNGFDGDTPFRANCSKVWSHSLHNFWQWVSVFVPICCKRKLLWWWLSKVLIYEYSRMSLGVIL